MEESNTLTTWRRWCALCGSAWPVTPAEAARQISGEVVACCGRNTVCFCGDLRPLPRMEAKEV